MAGKIKGIYMNVWNSLGKKRGIKVERKLFLIDGNSLLNRAYYALPPLTTVQGIPTNAVYGFVTMLYRLLDEYHPDKIYVAFDVSGPTFRHEAYDEYKANRKGMPDDLKPQVSLVKSVLDAWGIERLELPGYEADDIIGTTAKKGERAGYQVYIVTGDRDALQLVSDQITVLLTKRGIKELEVVDPDALKEQYQLRPEQIIDLKGLMGDSSDNIPGVPGIGEKTALKLLEKYGTIKSLYQNLDREKGKLKETLAKHKDLALLSRKLATIDCQIPIEVDFQSKPAGDVHKLFTLFTELEFKSLIVRLQKELGIKIDGLDATPASQNLDALDYTFLKPELLSKLSASLAAAQKCGIYYDGQHLAAAAGSELWYIEPKYWDSVILLMQEKSAQTAIYCNDSKSLVKLCADHKGRIDQFHIAGDVSLAAYVLDPSGKGDLSTLSVRYGNLPPLMEVGSEPDQAVEKAMRVLALGDILEKEIEAQEMLHLYHDVELPLAKVLAQMELIGIHCNPEKLERISAEMEKQLSQLTAEIYEFAGSEFNINSPKQLATILFDQLGLPVLKRTKTGPSTDAEVLEQLSFHPLVERILAYRQVNKLKTTYADALVNLIKPETGRIHTTFNQYVTATGRLSSANPNLQNIPVRTAEGRRIRSSFEPESGWLLLTADYSQIELRVLAHLSGDQGMIDAFSSGIDIHRRTAAEVMGIPLEAVTAEQRDSAKAINFGIVYGISSFGLAKGANLSQAQAQKYIDQYFARYPQVKAYLDQMVSSAKEMGYVTTILNRRRYLPDIASKNYQRRSFAERTAMNTPIQGSAADIIKMAMLRIDQALKARKLQARMLLQVHDELVFEVRPQELETVARLVKENMESVMDLKVPLVVDLKAGKDWEHVDSIEVK